jgi:ribosome maturation factor RimP
MGMMEEKLLALAKDAASGLGLEVDEVELLGQGRHKKLRVVIERPGGAVSLGDCENMSNDLSAALDVEDPIKSTYALEVTSAGLDRPLKRLETYRKCAGKLARLIMKGTAPVKGGVLVGRISAVDGERITLYTAEGAVTVEFSDIAKARLEVEI